MKSLDLIKSSFLKLLCIKKKINLEKVDFKKFLILMNQNIGDAVVCSPILREIKLAYPNSEIHVLASAANKDVALINPNIDKVIIYQNKWHKLLPLLLSFRKDSFEVAIELESKVVTKVILMLKIIRPKYTFSVSKTQGRYGMKPNEVMPYDFYTDRHNIHQRDTCLDILRLLKINYKNKSYEIFYTEKNKLNAVSFLSSFNSSKIFIAINTKGSSETNKITNKDVRKIILGLYAKSQNIVILLLHNPNERREIAKLIPEEAKPYTFLSHTTESILDVAALIDVVDLVISPDTSIVHIACALQKPLVSIYTANINNFNKWYPISKSNEVVFSKDNDSLKEINIKKIIDSSFNLLRINSQP